MSTDTQRVALPSTMEELAGICVALGAREVTGWSSAEERIAKNALTPSHSQVSGIRERIERGEDPLGDAFCAIRSAADRRDQGQTYTPKAIVDSMVSWAMTQETPARVVDPGVGSGRFLVAAGAVFPDADLVGSDLDPVAAMMARANLVVNGFASRARVVLKDYRSLRLPRAAGPTAFVGNPPYVRHHDIDSKWKAWLTEQAAKRGWTASQLAGLHIHFFIATANLARPGDYGVLVTSSEWMDVNYGSFARRLFVHELGLVGLHTVSPEAMPFVDATTTATIASFSLAGSPGDVRVQTVRRLSDLKSLGGGKSVRRSLLVESSKWSGLGRPVAKRRQGYIELGDIARVHRGTVTGANKVWVTDETADHGLPSRVLLPSITKARELFAVRETLADTRGLKRVIDLPDNLDLLNPEELAAVERFLSRPEVRIAQEGYVASQRRAWWSVGMREPAPILATYMARQVPAFVRNVASARHINIAHGIYPRERMSGEELDALAELLRCSVTMEQGRTYAGGLTKFEPKEMERILIPDPTLAREVVA